MGASAYHLSVPLHAYALLRETLLPQVLETKTSSGNPSSYGGGYSARGTVMTNQDRSRYSVWAINRDKAATEITLNMPALAGKTLKANLASIGGGVTQINNYDRRQSFYKFKNIEGKYREQGENIKTNFW